MRYMPVPGGEADDLDRLEEEWHNRVTYPTGIFDPVWLRLAAAQDALIPSALPSGSKLKALNSLAPLAINTSGFTALARNPCG